MSLTEYRKKRDPKKTREPFTGRSSKKNPIFVVQEHWASHLHYDFRLEAFGTLKSWAVPKGPSTEVGDKRLAVEVEDHPIDYAKFHGTIPEGEYGAGKVKIWDHGTWVPPERIKESLTKGHLEFSLKGKKLHGKWLLQRTNRNQGKKNLWLLIKRHDDKEPIKKTAKKTKKDPWPTDISPQLALLSSQVPKGSDWIHEIKLDGYRTITEVRKKTIKCLTRSGLDWTKKYSPLDQEFKKLKIDSAIFDGEIVALNEKGASDFSALQAAIKDQDMSDVVYYIFDLLYLNGEDLREKPLEERKQLLKKVLPKNSKKLIFSEHWRDRGEELFKKACQEGLEGIVSKDRTAAYRSGRSDIWQKIKCSNRQEFVIGGFTEPQGERQNLGALLMGVYENKKFRYIGRVGTGLNAKTLNDVSKKLFKLESKTSPYDIDSPKDHATIHWVKPQLVAEIEFKAWTGDGILRHASFVGLREDKKAKDVHVEKPGKTSKKTKSKSKLKTTKDDFVITHPDRVIYPDHNVTKLDVAHYYKSVTPWLLEHLTDRPISLLRCPDEAGKNCFFQKHIDNAKLTDVHESLAKEKKQKLIYVDSEKGVLQLVQWGVLEIHTWQCHVETVMKPDQIIFDLDPDEGVPWKNVMSAAYRLKDLLEQLNLKTFVKTTGGKGLHIHVPVAPKYSWDNIKAFSKTVVTQLASESPELFTVNILKKTRKGKIFLDYLRNGWGATAVTPYSLRSKSEPTVAVPLTWKELEKIKSPTAFDIDSTLKHLTLQKTNPWPRYNSLKQKIKILEK